METVQIFGLITFSISAICGTILIWKSIDSKREKEVEQHRINKVASERIASDNAWALYENERAMRVQAETREGIARHQLARERAKSSRLEQLLSVADSSEKKASA